ncbi:hypothetical protein BJX63DRAFT_223842 [Aspergillus granulosus]|uniref:Uncharacterized protein n=1 Tax=Aspergillus granulosus TaxID=176169 RepID=A0ABR4I1Q8_9EURO
MRVFTLSNYFGLMTMISLSVSYFALSYWLHYDPIKWLPLTVCTATEALNAQRLPDHFCGYSGNKSSLIQSRLLLLWTDRQILQVPIVFLNSVSPR